MKLDLSTNATGVDDAIKFVYDKPDIPYEPLSRHTSLRGDML
jgi:hypothetical protein